MPLCLQFISIRQKVLIKKINSSIRAWATKFSTPLEKVAVTQVFLGLLQKNFCDEPNNVCVIEAVEVFFFLEIYAKQGKNVGSYFLFS